MGSNRLIRGLYRPPTESSPPEKREEQKKDISLPYIYFPPQVFEKINSEVFIQQLIR